MLSMAPLDPYSGAPTPSREAPPSAANAPLSPYDPGRAPHLFPEASAAAGRPSGGGMMFHPPPRSPAHALPQPQMSPPTPSRARISSVCIGHNAVGSVSPAREAPMGMGFGMAAAGSGSLSDQLPRTASLPVMMLGGAVVSQSSNTAAVPIAIAGVGASGRVRATTVHVPGQTGGVAGAGGGLRERGVSQSVDNHTLLHHVNQQQQQYHPQHEQPQQLLQPFHVSEGGAPPTSASQFIGLFTPEGGMVLAATVATGTTATDPDGGPNAALSPQREVGIPPASPLADTLRVLESPSANRAPRRSSSNPQVFGSDPQAQQYDPARGVPGYVRSQSGSAIEKGNAVNGEGSSSLTSSSDSGRHPQLLAAGQGGRGGQGATCGSYGQESAQQLACEEQQEEEEEEEDRDQEFEDAVEAQAMDGTGHEECRHRLDHLGHGAVRSEVLTGGEDDDEDFLGDDERHEEYEDGDDRQGYDSPHLEQDEEDEGDGNDDLSLAGDGLEEEEEEEEEVDEVIDYPVRSGAGWGAAPPAPPYVSYPVMEPHMCVNCTRVFYGHACRHCGHPAGVEVVSAELLAEAVECMRAGQAEEAAAAQQPRPRRHAQDAGRDEGVFLSYDDRCREHLEEATPGSSGGQGRSHPERPERVAAIMTRLQATGLLGRFRRLTGREATLAELLAVHDPDLVTELDAAAEAAARAAEAAAGQRGSGAAQEGDADMGMGLESGPRRSPHILDCYFNATTAACARLAAGSAADVAARVASGAARAGAAIIRPPGHHAESSVAMGFCYYNNAAVAARAAQAAGARRVVIMDWDVHHGNGTQRIFYDDPTVLYMSTHRYDHGSFYPGTGGADEVGTGAGYGATVNVPFNRSGVTDADILAAFRHVILPIAAEFRPDMLIISAGFDAVAGDPLGGCRVSPAAFGHLTALLAPLAPTVLLLEGGYNLSATAAATEACLRVLLGEAPPPLPAAAAGSACGADAGGADPWVAAGLEGVSDSATDSIREALRAQSRFWQAAREHRAVVEGAVEEAQRRHAARLAVLAAQQQQQQSAYHQPAPQPQEHWGWHVQGPSPSPPPQAPSPPAQAASPQAGSAQPESPQAAHAGLAAPSPQAHSVPPMSPAHGASDPLPLPLPALASEQLERERELAGCSPFRCEPPLAQQLVMHLHPAPHSPAHHLPHHSQPDPYATLPGYGTEDGSGLGGREDSAAYEQRMRGLQGYPGEASGACGMSRRTMDVSMCGNMELGEDEHEGEDGEEGHGRLGAGEEARDEMGDAYMG